MITDVGMHFIEANKNQPFFLYLSHFEAYICKSPSHFD